MIDGETPLGAHDPKEVIDTISSQTPADETSFEDIKQSKEYLENARKLYEAEQKDVKHMGESPFQDVVLPEGIEVTKASVPVEILDKPIGEIGEIAKRNGWGTGKMLKDAKPVSRAVKDVTATPLPTTNQPSK